MITSNILKGKKVRLTALTKEDLPTFTGWYEDTGFSRLLDAVPAVPKSQAQWAEWLDSQHKEKDTFTFAIRAVDDDSLLGFAELDGILWTHRNCWLGIGLGERQNWDKGLGREAIELLLTFAFNELNLHRIQLSVFGYNERAIALYEKLGFRREGTMREHLRRDGQWHDMHLYGLLHQEWDAR